MKFLHSEELVNLNIQLSQIPVSGARLVSGKVELYSMKQTKSDKFYYASLEEQWDNLNEYEVPSFKRPRSVSAGMVDDLADLPAAKIKRKHRSMSYDISASMRTPPLPAAKKQTRSQSTTLGDVHAPGFRRRFTDLILTLNSAFGDYDFAVVQPTDFVNLTVSRVTRIVHEKLGDGVPQSLWTSIDAAIDMEDSQIYQFNLDQLLEDDTMLWSLCFLFVNRTKKRIMLFSCQENVPEKEDPANTSVEYEKFVATVETEESIDHDFDLDPSAQVGGEPISTT